MNIIGQKARKMDEAWEDGSLGQTEAHAKRVEGTEEGALDEALELQLISMRLQKSLIASLKVIGQAHGIGYQPLMRQVLKRFADSEMRRLLKDSIDAGAHEDKPTRTRAGRPSQDARQKQRKAA